MKHLVAALVMAAFSAATLAQGTSPTPPAGNTAAATSTVPAKSETKKSKKKKKKAKKSTDAAHASDPKPTK